MNSQRTNREDRVQRIRVGLTGLAFIVLAAAVGNAILTTLSDPEVTTASQNAAKAAAGSGEEPLVDLGVVPGKPEEKKVPAPKAVPAPPVAKPVPAPAS
jgi:hypothetical protein